MTRACLQTSTSSRVLEEGWLRRKELSPISLGNNNKTVHMNINPARSVLLKDEDVLLVITVNSDTLAKSSSV